jgi:hypothetical protein
LDFANERLEFDPISDVRIHDDGSVEAIDHEIRRLRVIRAHLGNGRTEIYRADTRDRLGRTDPFIPFNIDLIETFESIDSALDRLDQEREKRKRCEAPRND